MSFKYIRLKESLEMDILKSKVKPLYFKYLMAASGSAMVASVFGMVDAMMEIRL